MVIDFCAHVPRESAVCDIPAINLHYSTVNRERKWAASSIFIESIKRDKTIASVCRDGLTNE